MYRYIHIYMLRVVVNMSLMVILYLLILIFTIVIYHKTLLKFWHESLGYYTEGKRSYFEVKPTTRSR